MGPKTLRADKKTTPPIKKRPSTSPRQVSGKKLSELEKLKLEIKSKDDLIKNYKDERRRRERDQIMVINSFKKKLKEKDIKTEIKAGLTPSKVISIKGGKGNSTAKESKPIMRVGPKLKNNTIDQQKFKPCVVRLHKVSTEVQKETPTPKRTVVSKKPTGPLKKRPPTASPKVVKKVKVKSTTVASTRTRRAPKPNPKYLNADLVTPKSKGKKDKLKVELEDEDDIDSAEEFYNNLEDSTEESDNNDTFEINESSESSDIEDFDEKPKRTLRNTPPSTGSSPGAVKRGRPKAILSNASPPVKTIEPKKVVQQLVQPTRATPTSMPSQLLSQARKRKLEQIQTKAEPPESIIARNKRLNIALYDANVAKPIINSKPLIPKTTSISTTPRTQSPSGTSLLLSKRPAQVTSPIRTVTYLKDTLKEKSKSPLQKRIPAIKPSEPIEPEEGDPASTQDDFETMPTFTIVNIHDIINKKGDTFSAQKSSDDSKESVSPSNTNRVNRRKTGHTTILSEKIETDKLAAPLPRTPFPPRKVIPTVQGSKSTPHKEPKPTMRTSLPSPEKKPLPVAVPVPIEKPAPRILNSVVAKRTHPVKPILGKLDNETEMDVTADIVEKNQMVKENVGANKTLPVKPAQQRKLPPEKVFVQRQGNKLIKKITCFETWYVINIPEQPEPIVKNQLDIPLITLSNAVKSIKLPSPSWSTKVTLYKLSTQMLSKTNLTPYTGDISDQSIPEEDRDKYQPSCVMFRRMTQEKSKTRMPYDRAVIFKMKTFFTNIDGKNVRLVGAPSTISSFDEIEVLLELVDELDLLHEFVEPASTV